MRLGRPVIVGIVATALFAAPRGAAAQSIVDVLSFLMTNRSVATGDFVRDERAAAATSDAIGTLLIAELGTLPLGSSASGFTYRLHPGLGATVRTTDSFGPMFTERAVTIGQSRRSFGLSYQTATYDNLDGRELRDGTLMSTAAQLRGDAQPFDVETLSLHLRTDTTTLSATFGITDRFDLNGALPFVHVSLQGERVDTYRGTAFVQAVASGEAVGVGDAVVRAKYHVAGGAASGLALGVETRLPVGNEENLLGAGRASVRPLMVASIETPRVGTHINAGYTFGGVSDELNYAAAVTFIATPRVTGFGEIAGRRSASIGQLEQISEPHPTLIGVDTIRLTTQSAATERLAMAWGVKWNIGGSWLFGATLLRPLTGAGLNASWVPTFTLDYSFGG